MIRCPRCQSPNPESNLHCRNCGELLPQERRPLWLASDWLKNEAALEALRGALAAGIFQALSAGRFLAWAAERNENGIFWYFTSYALLLAGLGLGWRAWRWWLPVGLAGGLLAYSLDFFYNYQHFVYKAVWWTVTVLAPSGDNRAAETAYGLLQMLRFFGLTLPLVVVGTWSRRALMQLKAALGFLLAGALVFHVRGAALRFSLSWDFGSGFLLYFSAVFLLYYGLDRLDGNTPK